MDFSKIGARENAPNYQLSPDLEDAHGNSIGIVCTSLWRPWAACLLERILPQSCSPGQTKVYTFMPPHPVQQAIIWTKKTINLIVLGACDPNNQFRIEFEQNLPQEFTNMIEYCPQKHTYLRKYWIRTRSSKTWLLLLIKENRLGQHVRNDRGILSFSQQ